MDLCVTQLLSRTEEDLGVEKFLAIQEALEDGPVLSRDVHVRHSGLPESQKL